MKTCPTCRANVFNDMSTCYSCLFRFDAKPDLDEDFLEVDEPATATTAKIATSVTPATAAKPAPRATPAAATAPTAAASPAASGACAAPAHPSLPSPCAPKHAKAAPNDWIVRFEMRNADDPCQTWSIELNPANWPTALAPA